MIIEIDGITKVDVKEQDLVIKDGKLFNTTTGKFEGIDGDVVTYTVEKNGTKFFCCGTVDGYTYNSRVKLRTKSEATTDATGVRIDHASSITSPKFNKVEGIKLVFVNS